MWFKIRNQHNLNFMEKKKILIVSRSFYPQISPRSFRTTELVKEFARQGHSVTLLTQKNENQHVPFENKFGVTIKNLGALKYKNIDIQKGNKYWRIIKRGFRRLLNLLFEYPDIELVFLVNKLLKNENNYDLIISVAVPYPIHWGVAMCRSEKHPIAKIWVADCGDPYMGEKTDSFRKLFYFGFVEKWFMRKTDYISITKNSFKVNYYPEFHQKIIEIPQGFKFEDVKIISGKVKNDIPTFAFAGGLIKGTRDPKKFLSYLESIEIDFKFILYTKSLSLLEPFLEQLGGKIEIREYIPRLQLIYELSKMDFLVNFEYDPQVQSPSKLIDYGLSKRPILNIISKEFDSTIVNDFLSGNYVGKFHLADFDKYRIENICGTFLELLNRNDK